MLSKVEYIKFCEQNDVCIFSKPWWLDAVIGKDNWDVLLYKRSEKILAAMPFAFQRKGKWIDIKEPPLTQKNGVFFLYPKNQKYASKLSFERKVLKYFIEELEKLNIYSYNQEFDYNFTNWLPFYWEGYRQTSRYTYVIENTANMGEVYNQIDSTTKNLIRKAEKLVDVFEDLSLDEFYNINCKTFQRKGMKIPYSYDLIKKIDKSCKENKCSKILYAKDKSNNIHAAIYLVWDKNSIYYLMGGINPEFKNSNATSLLLLKGIYLASELGVKFDFEGSMNKGIENFFSSFGGVQKQYFTIYKDFKFNFKKWAYSTVNNSYNFKKRIKRILRK